MTEVVSGWGVYAFEERDPIEVHVVEEVAREQHEPVTTCACQPYVERQPNGGLMVSHGPRQERPI